MGGRELKAETGRVPECFDMNGWDKTTLSQHWLSSPCTCIDDIVMVLLHSSDTMRLPLRIALLECDELAGGIKEEYGTISNLYQNFFQAGASKLEVSGFHERPSLDLYRSERLSKP
jgi:hypothetical protein